MTCTATARACVACVDVFSALAWICRSSALDRVDRRLQLGRSSDARSRSGAGRRGEALDVPWPDRPRRGCRRVAAERTWMSSAMVGLTRNRVERANGCYGWNAARRVLRGEPQNWLMKLLTNLSNQSIIGSIPSRYRRFSIQFHRRYIDTIADKTR